MDRITEALNNSPKEADSYLGEIEQLEFIKMLNPGSYVCVGIQTTSRNGLPLFSSIDIRTAPVISISVKKHRLYTITGWYDIRSYIGAIPKCFIKEQ